MKPPEPEFINMPGSETYVVNGDRGEILVPTTEDVVKSIDVNKRCLVIEPIKGLLSL